MLTRPVLVGHSRGGAVVLEAARRHTNLPAAVIAVEGTIIFPAETRAMATPMVVALRSPAWRGHDQMLATPAQVTAMIDRFVEVEVRGRVLA